MPLEAWRVDYNTVRPHSALQQQTPAACAAASAGPTEGWGACSAAPGMPTAKKASPDSPSRLMDAEIREPRDWRARTLARLRTLIRQADPDVVEELKWKKPSHPAGVSVWSHEGMICTGETYKDHVKLTFAKGAALKDPFRLFNSSLEGNARCAIDIREGDKIDEKAFKTLVQAAVVLNTSREG